MVVEKQKELYKKYTNNNFNILKADYLLALKDSYDKELFIKSGYETLKRIFDTKYRNPTQDLKADKPTAYFRNVQFVHQINLFNYLHVRNDFYNLLEGRQRYYLILYPEMERIEKVDEDLRRELFTGALFELYKYIGEKHTDILQPEVKTMGEQIKWLGGPAQFGYLFAQLVQKDFIELPKSKGVGSYTKLAKICFKAFNIDGKQSSLIKELSPNSNSLENVNREPFKIPYRKDLS